MLIAATSRRRSVVSISAAARPAVAGSEAPAHRAAIAMFAESRIMLGRPSLVCISEKGDAVWRP